MLVQILIFLVASCLSSSNPPRIIIPPTATYANLAWGYAGPGKDDLTGQYVVLVDIDEVDANQVQTYKNQGRIVQCYFSVGTCETFRADYTSNQAKWKALAVGTLPQFPDEFWLDLTQMEAIKALMIPRFQKAKTLGCDAIEPDNTDCYDNTECLNGIKSKVPSANVKNLDIEYCRWQVELAHSLGLSISLKNSLAIIPDLVDIYDFAVNEQCHQFSECSEYQPFISQNKAVFNFEYQSTSACSPTTIQTKKCDGSPSDGICKPAANWVNCFSRATTFPPRTFTTGTSFTKSPTTSKPTHVPTSHPTKQVVATKSPVITSSPTTPIKLRLLVPAYFYATSPHWTNLISTISSYAGEISVIVNPNSGPGTTKDMSYVNTISNARTAGGKLYGYVYSCYGRNLCAIPGEKRSVNQVVTDALQFEEWYGPLDGIFIDEMSDSLSDLSFYQNVTDQLKATHPSWKFIGNPGIPAPEAYLSFFDVIVNRESPLNAKNIPAASWGKSYSAYRQANIFYSVPTKKLSAAINLARSNNVGYIYVTSDKLANPYDILPRYFAQEVAKL